MSFSRLSTRSARTGLAPARASGRKPEESSRHLRLWEAIRRTRQEIENWQRQVDQVDSLFHQFIVQREERLTDEYCTVTSLLIGHFEHAGLNVADQSLLGLWINENLQALSDHPFAPIQRRQALNDAWRVLLSVEGAIENQLARLAQSACIATPSRDEKIRKPDVPTNTADTPYASRQDKDGRTLDGHTSESAKRTNATPDKEQANRPNSGDQRHSSNSDHTIESNDEHISILGQGLSIDRLFRQLAKVLHPDREQDESRKAQKHVLMSQCLKARREQDINTLLSLYCEHVGDLPDDLTDNSHEELISALQQQLKQLQMELRQMRFGDPLHTQIVERYSSMNDAECERRIMGHANSLDQEIENTKILTAQLESQTGLTGALEQRREVELDRLAIDELTGLS